MSTKKPAISRFSPPGRRRSDQRVLARPLTSGRGAMSRMPRSVLERPVFSIAGRTYRWQDVLDAGRHWGDLALLERQAGAGIAALDYAATTGPPLDEAEVIAEEDAFRHEHKLLAAEEMMAWLARWELAYDDDWLAYCRRVVARARLDGQLAESTAFHAPNPARVAGAVWAETVCSGALAGWVWKLAGLLASADALAGSPGSDLSEAERAAEEQARRLLTPEAMEKALQARRSDWVQIECAVLELHDEGMAREAALSVAEGMSLPEVAARAEVSIVEQVFSLDEAGPELAQPLLGATAGDVVGPVVIGDRYVFAAVRDKRIPSLDDPVVQTLVREEVQRRAINTEIGERIQWIERP